MAGKGKSPMLIYGSTVLPVTMVYIAASLVKKHGIGSQLKGTFQENQVNKWERDRKNVEKRGVGKAGMKKVRVNKSPS